MSSNDAPEHAPREIPITIDKKEYKVPADLNPVTGEYLRSLPPVGEEYDLWLRRDDGDDELIEPSTEMRLHPGMHFYTAKKVITPGC